MAIFLAGASSSAALSASSGRISSGWVAGGVMSEAPAYPGGRMRRQSDRPRCKRRCQGRPGATCRTTSTRAVRATASLQSRPAGQRGGSARVARAAQGPAARACGSSWRIAPAVGRWPAAWPAACADAALRRGDTYIHAPRADETCGCGSPRARGPTFGFARGCQPRSTAPPRPARRARVVGDGANATQESNLAAETAASWPRRSNVTVDCSQNIPADPAVVMNRPTDRRDAGRRGLRDAATRRAHSRASSPASADKPEHDERRRARRRRSRAASALSPRTRKAAPTTKHAPARRVAVSVAARPLVGPAQRGAAHDRGSALKLPRSARRNSSASDGKRIRPPARIDDDEQRHDVVGRRGLAHRQAAAAGSGSAPAPSRRRAPRPRPPRSTRAAPSCQRATSASVATPASSDTPTLEHRRRVDEPVEDPARVGAHDERRRRSPPTPGDRAGDERARAERRGHLLVALAARVGGEVDRGEVRARQQREHAGHDRRRVQPARPQVARGVADRHAQRGDPAGGGRRARTAPAPSRRPSACRPRAPRRRRSLAERSA